MEKIKYPGSDYSFYKTNGLETVGSGPVVATIHQIGDDEASVIGEGNIDLLVENGLSVAILPYGNIAENLAKIKPAGILLPGGAFPMPPETIAGPYMKKELDLRRFDAYMALLNYAWLNKLPTLGICAGMQTMATWLGGKIAGGKAGPMHKIAGSKTDAIHDIKIEKDSLLYKIIGKESIPVHSFHKSKIIDEFMGNFNITARAPDDVIEAIEPKEPWNEFVLATQWHPERGADGQKIFSAFTNTIKKSLKLS